MRAAQLADESPHRLAHRGGDEVELTSLGCRPKWSVLLCRLIVGFQLSTEVGQLAPELLPAKDWPHVRHELEARATDQHWMPIFVSRLLPPAKKGHEDNPETREGYLRHALATTTVMFAPRMIAAEMVRSNLEAQWPVLRALFQTEPSRAGQDAKEGVLHALGEAPHTNRKLAALVSVIDDPRNATLLTQRNGVMGDDSYRQEAVWSLNAIAGTQYVSHKMLEDLRSEQRSGTALVELRRLARGLLQTTIQR